LDAEDADHKCEDGDEDKIGIGVSSSSSRDSHVNHIHHVGGGRSSMTVKEFVPRVLLCRNRCWGLGFVDRELCVYSDATTMK